MIALIYSIIILAVIIPTAAGFSTGSTKQAADYRASVRRYNHMRGRKDV